MNPTSEDPSLLLSRERLGAMLVIPTRIRSCMPIDHGLADRIGARLPQAGGR